MSFVLFLKLLVEKCFKFVGMVSHNFEALSVKVNLPVLVLIFGR